MKYDLSKVIEYELSKLYYFEKQIDLAINSFKTLINENEETIKNLKLDLANRIKTDDDFNKLKESYKGSYYSQVFSDYEETINELMVIQRSSLLISLYSFIEGNLKQICELVNEKYNLGRNIKNIRQDVIYKCNLFLIKDFKITPGKSDVYFKAVLLQKDIRNCFTHNNGTIESYKIGTYEGTEGLTIKTFGKENKVTIDSSVYLLNSIESIENYFKYLIIEIDTRCKQLKIV